MTLTLPHKRCTTCGMTLLWILGAPACADRNCPERADGRRFAGPFIATATNPHGRTP